MKWEKIPSLLRVVDFRIKMLEQELGRSSKVFESLDHSTGISGAKLIYCGESTSEYPLVNTWCSTGFTLFLTARFVQLYFILEVRHLFISRTPLQNYKQTLETPNAHFCYVSPPSRNYAENNFRPEPNAERSGVVSEKEQQAGSRASFAFNAIFE